MKKYQKSFATVSQMALLVIIMSIYAWMVPVANQMPVA